MRSAIVRLGSDSVGVWVVKHMISPLNRLTVSLSGGRLPTLSSLVVPTLLLTTLGGRTGRTHTIPLLYVRDANRYIVGNPRPAGQRKSPWVLNLRAAGRARVTNRRQMMEVNAIELDEIETETWWPHLARLWPAFAAHFAATGARSLFALEPHDEVL